MRSLNSVLLTPSRHYSNPNLNYIINEYIRNGRLSDARTLFDHNPTSRDVVSWNSMIAAYIRNDQMQRARDLFDEMPVRDVVSWNTMLSGSQRAKNPEQVCLCFLEMLRVGVRCNEFTMSIVISAILNTKFNCLVPQLHAGTIRVALNHSVFVGSALLRGYANLGDHGALRKVFDDILEKEVTSWNALIAGYMELGCASESQKLFDAMPEKNVVSWTTLVNGYIANKNLNKARSLFDKMSEKNVVSWTAMISGYVQNSKFVDALKLYRLMFESRTKPNNFTCSSVLDACAGCSSLIDGQQVHSYVLKTGMPSDVVLFSSLLDMYAKCGDLEAAFCIFKTMPRRNVVSYNALIGGYATNGLGTRALEEYENMKKCGVRPDRVTFVNVLSACAYGGLVEEGERHFGAMETDYGIQADIKHYACMVDLYGRAGYLERAFRVIIDMPFEPDAVVWGALLGACGLHSCLELGEFAARGIHRLQRDHPAIYTIPLKIQGEKGAWNNVIELRKMKENHSKKQKAGSRIICAK